MSKSVWDERLWDRPKELYEFCKSNADYLKHYADFLERRCKVEEKYAKDLRKLCKEFRPKDYGKDEKVQFSVQCAQKKMLGELESLSNQHDFTREELMKQTKEAKEYSKDLLKAAHSISKQIAAHEDEIRKKKIVLRSVRAEYQSALEDVNKAERDYNSVKDNPNVTKMQEESLSRALAQKSNELEFRRNTLAKDLTDFNALQRDTYQKKLPGEFNKYEALAREYCTKCRSQFVAWSETELKSLEIQTKCAQSMRHNCEEIDADADIQHVLTITQSGHPVPEDFEFTDYSNFGSKDNIAGKDKNKNKKNQAAPAQQRRRLELQLEKKQAELDKARKELEGVTKMMEVCGESTDKNQLQRQLQESTAKVNQAQADYNALLALPSNGYHHHQQQQQLQQQQQQQQQQHERLIRRTQSNSSLNEHKRRLNLSSLAKRPLHFAVSTWKELAAVGVDTSSRLPQQPRQQQQHRPSLPNTQPGNAFDDEFEDESPGHQAQSQPDGAASAVAASTVPTAPPAPPPPQQQQQQQQHGAAGRETRCMLYDFDSAQMPDVPDCLNVRANERLYVIRDEEDGWSLVERIDTGEQGVVPTDYMA